ncbi:shikimate dehydrogenase [Streptomyces sp. NBC_00638]|uniref:shikimate dehydrogenase n=1 Tax=unclassified Streptomyces TaxID=2593676 RepID=UPI002251DED7|nr:shikimate dehydrogenase [Streptomyces sp. NBC_00638]MCX5001305.1 shikimate dehydrogenase [Streptomyces sp. NBC_00638]
MTQYSYLVGLIGSPIGHSLSPALHESEADRHGVRYLYRLLDAGSKPLAEYDLHELLRACRDCGFSGLNVTHPFKQSVVPHLDELAPTAARVGAVNTVVFTPDGRAVGHNTDVSGFSEALARGLPDVSIDEVVLLGAGGAGAAVSRALLDGGTRQLHIVDPLQDRATALAKALNEQAGPERARPCSFDSLEAVLSGARGLVNASPVGSVHDRQLPLPAAMLHARLWLADLNYRPLQTPLLKYGRARGSRVLHGGGMLVHQAAHSFRLFTGLDPHTPHMLADFADLTADAQAHA